MIAISYRREDSLLVVGRIYDRLVAEFGEGAVFMDFDSIPYGVDFREHIERSLDQADVLVAIIGPQWAGKTEKATARIEDPEDFVRLEIAKALRDRIPVIPILINNTPMPDKGSLPEEIRALAFRNALRLDTGVDFHPHVGRLIGAINRHSSNKAAAPLKPVITSSSGEGSRQSRRLLLLWTAAALGILLAGALAWFLISRPIRSRPQSGDAADIKATKERPFENSLGMKFVPVAISGGPTVAKPVFFSVVETRVREFAQFVEENGYNMEYGEEAFTVEPDSQKGFAWKRAGGNWRDPHFPSEAAQSDEHPVVCVSWEDATEFCKWLTKREHDSKRLPPGWSYRLPTDHEWSCAVGIGDREDPDKMPVVKDKKLRGVYPWGTKWPPPPGAGNYAGEESWLGILRGWEVVTGYRDDAPRTAPVGRYSPNKFGIYDLGGNVWEWCEDKHAPAENWRVLRGAAWGDDRERLPEVLLSSYRAQLSPEGRRDFIGFRIVLADSSSHRQTP